MISMLGGILAGIVLFVLGIYFNPVTGRPLISPLTISKDPVMDLHYSTVKEAGLLFTNKKQNSSKIYPANVLELSEPALRDTGVLVTLLQDTAGNVVGLGIKMLSKSETTALITGAAIANSIWHIYLRNRGTIMIAQTENYWPYIRDVVIPAHLNSERSWQGRFHHITTNGPETLGTARVSGGNGLFTDLTTSSVESLTVAHYSSETGSVTLDGNLKIVIPKKVTTTN